MSVDADDPNEPEWDLEAAPNKEIFKAWLTSQANGSRDS